MRSYIIIDVTRLLIEREQPASFLLADDDADVCVSFIAAKSWLSIGSQRCRFVEEMDGSHTGLFRRASYIVSFFRRCVERRVIHGRAVNRIHMVQEG
jgi:hypothetical protein